MGYLSSRMCTSIIHDTTKVSEKFHEDIPQKQGVTIFRKLLQTRTSSSPAARRILFVPSIESNVRWNLSMNLRLLPNPASAVIYHQKSFQKLAAVYLSEIGVVCFQKLISPLMHPLLFVENLFPLLIKLLMHQGALTAVIRYCKVFKNNLSPSFGMQSSLFFGNSRS